jgi:hypothetical protein
MASSRAESAPKVRQPFALRASALRKEDANLLQGLDLDEDALDTIPDQIRGVLHNRYLRIIDIFRQFDDDENFTISGGEFLKAMRDCYW